MLNLCWWIITFAIFLIATIKVINFFCGDHRTAEEKIFERNRKEMLRENYVLAND